MKRSTKYALMFGFFVTSFLLYKLMTVNFFFSMENIKQSIQEVKYKAAKVENVSSSIDANNKIENTVSLEENQLKSGSTSEDSNQLDDSKVVSKNSSNYLIAGVPMIQQRPELPTGCEITSVTMMLLHAGFKVDKCKLALEMPFDKTDPEKGFVGDPFKKSGWTIYPNALRGVIKNRTGTFVNLTGSSNSDLEKQIRKNHPVAVWGKFIGFNLHCMLLVGYDSENYYFNDPWTGKSTWPLNRATFNQQWEALGKMAVSY